MEAVRVLGNLPTLALIPHGIVIRDAALLLDTEQIGEAGPSLGDEGGSDFSRRHGKAPVVGGEKPLHEIPVGGCPLRDPGARQVFRQAVLQSPEDPLRATSRFR